MKRLTAVLLLGIALASCDNGSGGGPGGAPGSGSEPSTGTGTFTLTASEKELVAAADGQPLTELLVAIGTIVGGRRDQVKKDQLIAALDQAFEVHCTETCEIKER